MVGQYLLSEQYMSKLRELGEPIYEHKKVTRTVFMAIDYQSTTNPKTWKTPRLRKIILLLSIVEIMPSWAKLWVNSLKKILIYIEEASKANLSIFQQLKVMLLRPKKAKSKTIETWVTSNASPVTRKSFMLASAPTKSQKTSVSSTTSLSMIETSKKANPKVQKGSEL